MPKKRIPLADRFWPKVVWQSNGCWNWTGYKTGYGYGLITTHTIGKKQFFKMVHRVAYELVKGPIPDGLQIDHLCRNKLCCHPYHLEAVTSKENTRRGLKGVLMTHCWRGHPFDESNTRINKDGRRICKKCAAAYRRNYERRKKAENAK